MAGRLACIGNRRIGLAALMSLALTACGGIIPNGPVQNGPVQSGAPPAQTMQPPRQTLPYEQADTSSTPQTSAPAARPQVSAPVRAAVQGDHILAGSDADKAIGRPVRRGPVISSLGLDAARSRAALEAFRTSCPTITKRDDRSGLTRPEDWRDVCAAAQGWSPSDARSFFERWFEAIQLDTGAAFATGYYEPQIRGSRTRRPGYDVPVYRRPGDLVDVDLGVFSEALKGKRVRGRVDGTSLVPYAERAAIDDGALAGRGLEIAWAADYIEFFFLQIQGSGRLLLPDGGVMRIGYGGQNGRDYLGIGAVLRDRDALAPGQASMQGIVDWLRAHSEEGRELMRDNKSYIFFQELTGPGPLGAMGYAVTPRTSVAADPDFLPLGAPVFLSMDRAEPNGIWIAQDTGGAIKGPNRFDTFWGAGDEARAIAGGMSARGQALLLLPRGTFDRLADISEERAESR